MCDLNQHIYFRNVSSPVLPGSPLFFSTLASAISLGDYLAADESLVESPFLPRLDVACNGWISCRNASASRACASAPLSEVYYWSSAKEYTVSAYIIFASPERYAFYIRGSQLLKPIAVSLFSGVGLYRIARRSKYDTDGENKYTYTSSPFMISTLNIYWFTTLQL